MVAHDSRPGTTKDLDDIPDPAQVEEDVGPVRAQVDAAVGHVLKALGPDAPWGGVDVLAAIGDMDIPVDLLVVGTGRTLGNADSGRVHVDFRLPVHDDMSAVHG